MVVHVSEEWSSQWIFQFKLLERRSLKKSGLQRDSNLWPLRIPVRCSTNWAMKPHIGSEVNVLSSYLPWGVTVKYIYEIIHVFCVDHSSLSSTTAVQIWIISYILQSQCKLEWITWVRTFFGWLLCQSCTLILGHDIGTAIRWLYHKDVQKHYHGQNANFLFPFNRIQCFSSLLILYNKQTLQVLCLGLYCYRIIVSIHRRSF